MTLYEAVSITIRRLHDSPRTGEAYVYWVRELVRSHRRHPREWNAAEVLASLNDLAPRRQPPASKQHRALCVPVSLPREALEIVRPVDR